MQFKGMTDRNALLDALTAMVFPLDDVEGAFAAQKSGLHPKIVLKFPGMYSCRR